jgi:hypothetical protein
LDPELASIYPIHRCNSLEVRTWNITRTTVSSMLFVKLGPSSIIWIWNWHHLSEPSL